MSDSAEPIRFDPDAKGPLNGIRVLDLSRLVAGNMLSLQLADFGADVIQEEPGADVRGRSRREAAAVLKAARRNSHPTER